MTSPVKVIGSTLGTDDVSDYRYFNFEDEDPRAFYWIGERLFCIGKKPPKLNGIVFTKHSDQLFAELSNTVLWVGVEEAA